MTPILYLYMVFASAFNDIDPAVTVTITAYSEYDSCHYEGCPMASGKRAYVGAAACPRDWKLGTKLFIEDIGLVTCEDRYSKRLNERVDVFVGYGKASHDKAVKFGKQQKQVFTIN